MLIIDLLSNLYPLSYFYRLIYKFSNVAIVGLFYKYNVELGLCGTPILIILTDKFILLTDTYCFSVSHRRLYKLSRRFRNDIIP